MPLSAIVELWRDYMKKTVFIMTQTAMLVAVLVAVQFLFSALGQFYVGPLVNLLLVLAAFLLHRIASITASIISPFVAFTLGIGTTFFVLVPWIAVGNLIAVITILMLQRVVFVNSNYWQSIAMAAIGLLMKVITYWLTLSAWIIPSLQLPELPTNALIYTFTWAQLITASVAMVLIAASYRLLINKRKKWQYD